MKTREKEEMEKAGKLLATIEKHPLTQQILAEKAAQTLATRQEAAGKIEALRKEQTDSLPKLQAVEKEKETKFLKAKAALQAASDEFQAAHLALSSENHNFDTDIRNHEAVLFETADPLIDKTIQFFRDKLDDLRKPGRISSRGMTVERNIFTDIKTLTTETNEGAIKGAMSYCMAAIKGLEALKLSPEFHIEGIQELKDALPSIEVYQEVTGEKPLPRPWAVNPRDFLKSDSQMEWEMGKLNEKFKKVMGKHGGP